MKAPVTAVILAGGQSRRIGRDKAFLRINNKTVLEILIGKLRPHFREVIISVKSPEKYSALQGVRLVSDVRTAGGSVVGIYSALRAMRTAYGFVIACDMPLVRQRLIKQLLENRRGVDVVMPVTSRGLEPLCAVYSKRCLNPILRMMQRRDFKIIDFLPEIKVKVLRYPDREFFNINTPRDYQQAKRWLR